MSNEQTERTNNSTYRLITTKRLLERYSITLTDEQLVSSFQRQDTFYHRLLRIPLKNILNGIILQQTKDYQLYLQKVFIDYLLSLESNKPEEEEELRSASDEHLETLRLNLVAQNEKFMEVETNHQRLIGHSQAALVKHATDWKNKIQIVAKSIEGKFSQHLSQTIVLKVLNDLLIYVPLEGSALTDSDLCWTTIEKQIAIALSQADRQIFLQEIPELIQFALASETTLATYWASITDMTAQLRVFRTFFQQHILKVNESIQQRSEYKVDVEQSKKNREDLYFDPSIGDPSLGEE